MNPKSSFSEKRNLDKVILFIIPAFATLIIFAFKLPFIISILLFFGLPSLWLSLRNKAEVLEALLFCIAAVPFILIIDYMGVLNESWLQPTIFSFKIFGVSTVEDLLWGFLFLYSVVMYYEYFFDTKKSKFLVKNTKYTFLFVLIFSLVFFIILNINRTLFEIPYFYLKGGLIGFLAPVIILLSIKEKLLMDFIKTALYFFIVTLLFELSGIAFNHWFFPGYHFIRWIELIGYMFPVEEFIFLIFFGSSGVLAHYKVFIDREDM